MLADPSTQRMRESYDVTKLTNKWGTNRFDAPNSGSVRMGCIRRVSYDRDATIYAVVRGFDFSRSFLRRGQLVGFWYLSTAREKAIPIDQSAFRNGHAG